MKPYLQSLANYKEQESDKVLVQSQIINVSEFLEPNGRFAWEALTSDWTII